MAGTSNFTTLFNRHASKRCAGHRKHHSRCSHGGSAGIEQLEPRFAMTSAGPVAATSAAGVLSIAYAASAEQNVVIEIDEVFPAIGAALTRVNVYTSSNPQALVFTGITSIQVVVPTYDTPGVNNNALTIKGITGLPDRIIVSGSGRTSAGRWSDQSAPQLQVLFDIEGIDDLTLTSGGVINVSGAFTNDTSDASIHVIGSIPEFSNSQEVATIVVGETSSFPSTLPQPRLFSNFIDIIGAELDINSDIEATNQVILRLHETTPDTARANLVLPYDITVSDVALGVLELYSTKNIVQLQGSTLFANTLVAVSNYSNPSSIALIDGPWMIDLGSEKNDFNTVSLGMISAPGDKAASYTEGRISVRDTNALTVAGFGILAAAAQVRIDVAGALTFASPIQATGLIGESDDSIVSLAGAVMRLGDLGIALYANDTFSLGSTGDVTLNGPISIDDTDATALVSNKIQATGTTTLAGGIYAPLAGQTTITSSQGIVVGGPIQVGSTRFTSSGTTATVLDHDLALVSDAGSITVGSVVGNSSIPKTIQATNIISLSAFESIDIDGSIFAGTLYGNPLALIASTALPSITIRGNADVSITATGSLQTSAYQTNVDKSPNPLAGLVSISGAAQFNQLGALIADGAVSVDIVGDVFLTGPVKARESVTVKTSAGAIDVQGQIVSTGSTYALLPATPINVIRTPDIVLSAPNGAISTSGLGTLRAGTMLVGAGTTYGEVRLDAQRDILIGASIDTDGGMRATSQIGAFELDALLRTGARQLSPNFQTSFAYLEAFRGVSEGEFGRIITASLNATVTDPAVVAQISLQAFGNQIAEFNASNVSPLGDIELVNDSLFAVGAVKALGNINILSTAGVSRLGSITAGGTIDLKTQAGLDSIGSLTAKDAITLEAALGINIVGQLNSSDGNITIKSDLAVSERGNIVKAGDSITIDAKMGIRISDGEVKSISVQSRGKFYEYASITVSPPPGGGRTARAHAIINPLVVSDNGDVTGGEITSIIVDDPGSGYVYNEPPVVTIIGSPSRIELITNFGAGTEPISVTIPAGTGAVAVAVVQAFACKLVAKNDITLLSDKYIESSANLLTGTGGKIQVQAESLILDGLLDSGTDIDLGATQNIVLGNTILSHAGDISISSTAGNMDLSGDSLFVHALTGSITLTAPGGKATVQHLAAKKDVTINVQQGLVALNSINSVSGSVEMRTVNQNLDFTPAGALIGCETGSVTLTSTHGAILSPPVLHVGQDVTLTSFATVNLSNDITADSGTVTVESTSGGISLGGDIFAPVESIVLKANKNIVQVTRGIGAVAVLLGGSGYKTGRETVTVNGPGNVVAGGVLAAGQVAATARLIIGSVNGNAGTVIGIQILTPGAGYAVGEVVDVVIAPPQVIATAVGVQALATATAGTATQNLVADEDVTLTAGSKIVLRGDIIAGDAISLAAKNGITQEAGSVKAHSLTLSNTNNAAVTLANSANNVVQFAGTTLGSLAYVDADDFETGGVVARVGVPGDIKVEVKADALSLSSVGALSTIRVVSGLQYKTLRVAAQFGTVEFVTTSSLDNPSAIFQGSLRDMIRYANDNTATYASAGSQIPQRTAMVFDEGGYLVQEIIVAAALPAFVKPVDFDGSRLEAFATQARLGIQGKAGIKTGLFFGLGSSDSSITGTAVYGFKDGSAISLASSNNTVTNTYAGVKADGTTASANSVGLDLTGANARSNIIGSTVFDDTTANRFSANTQAGILIRAGAANNRIFGNILGRAPLDGTDTLLAPTFANGDGIRLNAAGGGNQIGTPSEVGPDLVPVVSNRIVGNKLSGIAFVNTIATASQTNRVRNNEIDSNGTGIAISASSFAVIGGPAAHAANVITRQTKAGISLTGSKDVQVIANFIGFDPELTTTPMGNTADGMAIASSQRVNIAGNLIAANFGNGISITLGSTAVTIAGNRIGVLEDDSDSGNVLDGVAINASIGNSIGSGNKISYNKNGVSVTDARGTAATGNKIVGSEIASNDINGVLLAGGSGTTIGGTTDGTQNTIKSNIKDGIRLEKTLKTGAPTGHLIQGNFIGTNENRDVDPSLGNGGNGITVSLGTFNTASGNVVMNNLVDGISIEGGNDNTVGGILTSAGNVIANNTANGISIKQESDSSTSTGHRIYGNTIVENDGNGVEVGVDRVLGSTPKIISKIFVGQDTTGKVVAGRGNTITDNSGAGVKITDAKQVAVQGNTMGNNRRHIELGPNANPSSGTVTLTSAVFRQPPGGGGKQVEIVGTIAGGTANANQVYSVDFYANDPGDKEGIRRFIGRGTATADSNGNARIRMTISSDVLLESTITATATSMRYDIGQTTGTLLGVDESRQPVRLR